MRDPDDHYAALGVDPAATREEIREAWRFHLAAFHPDRFRDPDTVHAVCEEYRAAATLDVAHDEADRAAGRRIACPTLALWSATGALDAWYDPLAVWSHWCAGDLHGRALPCGHFLPEEAPTAVATELFDLLNRTS